MAADGASNPLLLRLSSRSRVPLAQTETIQGVYGAGGSGCQAGEAARGCEDVILHYTKPQQESHGVVA